ncbi:HAD family hydrolase [Pseudalkalibacillus caeni]|uniref:HAD family hydrolase n=1 Tax=Exobacillus caeni TaxID=2574798 RepID=A0A5R9F1S3_9BACL|nr:HAD family hydrolase [Pseudalkalibacillus caeni]TLS37527.1 HAD family hydrolase [Pseudalkalibacillus caeni]
MNVRAVLFDLDGTLLDRMSTIRRFIAAQFDRYPAFHKVDKQTFCQRFEQLDANGYVWKDTVYEQLLKEFNVTSLEVQELLDDYLDRYSEYSVPYPGMKELLHRLGDKYKLGIITNGREATQLPSIKSLGIETIFEIILISETEGVKKPDPQIFRRAAELLDCDISECLYIGDHPFNDVEGAKQAGMKAIWKKSGDWEDCYENDGEIDGLLDVLPILEKLVK